jgi:hypothetical protein
MALCNRRQKAQNSVMCLYIYNTKNEQKLKKQAIKDASSNGYGLLFLEKDPN